MGTKLFVGNLDPTTNEDALKIAFSGNGRVVRAITIPNDRETGRPRGFAFVEFSSDEEAEEAIKRFDGYELGGRNLRVNAAEARSPSFGGGRGGFSPGGGGGFGGGGGYGGGGFGPNAPPKGGGKSKGSRRNVRAKKRSL